MTSHSEEKEEITYAEDIHTDSLDGSNKDVEHAQKDTHGRPIKSQAEKRLVRKLNWSLLPLVGVLIFLTVRFRDFFFFFFAYTAQKTQRYFN